MALWSLPNQTAGFRGPRIVPGPEKQGACFGQFPLCKQSVSVHLPHWRLAMDQLDTTYPSPVLDYRSQHWQRLYRAYSA